jgi:protein phosphatase
VPPTLLTGQCTLTGQRHSNEDAVAVRHFGGLDVCLVADGGGGWDEGGELASKCAVEIAARELPCRLPPTARGEQTRQIIHRSIVRANEEVVGLNLRKRNAGDQFASASTIVSATWQQGRELYIAHVGDSRAYQIRGERIERLTEDHDIARALIESGATREQVQAVAARSVLMRYLGSAEFDPGPDIREVAIQPADCFLLCTDGLSNVVPEEFLLRCVRDEQDVQRCAEVLGRMALDQGSRDNVSCVVIEVPKDLAGPIPSAERAKVSAVNPAWLSWNDGCVAKLVRSLRDGRRLVDLSVLADALEDAGCADQALLGHCRESGEHVFDCWVLESLSPRE